MRCISQIFQPLLTIPKNAILKNTEITCKSQKLLLECGLVRPTSSGFFSLLPLARRSVDKLEALIRRHLEAAGAQRVSFPSLTAAGLWKKTGRLEAIGVELMKVEDRHGKKYLLSPTHEEAVADLLADVGPLSYKQLPLLLYQISNKYRDEHRPKHGLLRAREFAMLDAYGAHATDDCAIRTYERIAKAYDGIFRELRLPVKRVSAPSGEMGGSFSHEWQLPASAGEDEIAVCPSCSHAALAAEVTTCEKCGKETEKFNSIEVGHTFILGTKYSDPLNAHFVPPVGNPKPLVMSCYGIGVTRLLSAGLEVLSSETSLRWPRRVAPYTALIIGPKEGSKEWSNHGIEAIQRVYERVCEAGLSGDVIVDDRHHLTIGKRVLMADRMGYPYVIVCGRSTLETPAKYEVYQSTPNKVSKPVLMTLDELTASLADKDPDLIQDNVEFVNKTSL